MNPLPSPIAMMLIPVQYPNTPTTLTIKIGDEEITEKGTLYAEATFISE